MTHRSEGGWYNKGQVVVSVIDKYQVICCCFWLQFSCCYELQLLE